MLLRRVGVQHLAAVEDSVQGALLRAVENWPVSGRPENPSAWLFRVALNAVTADLRQRALRAQLLALHGSDATDTFGDPAAEFLADDVRDDVLRMLCVCCDESIPAESQLALALKTVCGFDVPEIAARLLTSEANVYKRLGRARERLRAVAATIELPVGAHLRKRMSGVRSVLYQLFTEGYLSSNPQWALRRELCDEAIRLTEIVAEHRAGADPETFALLALMHLHTARMSARTNSAGGLLLLEEQDRAQWDRAQIQAGLGWLALSASGNEFTRFHAEAGIAAEHCLAPSFESTRWERIVACYKLLEQSAPSPMHALNRAVATAEWQGPEAGLAVLAEVEPPASIARSYLWNAVLADLHRRCGNNDQAQQFHSMAVRDAPSSAVRELLERRFHARAARID